MNFKKITKWNLQIEDDGCIEVESANGKFFAFKVIDNDGLSCSVVFSKEDVENLSEMLSDMLQKSD